MNKPLRIATILALCGVILYVFMHKKAVEQPTAGTTMVAFGDSLVVGVGASEGNDFVSLLSARTGVPIINAGISGNTTTDALLRLERDVMAHDPRVVIVVLGGNDFLRRMPKATTLANMRTIVERIRATGAAVILVGMTSLIYNSDYRDIAKDTGSQFVPRLLDTTSVIKTS